MFLIHFVRRTLLLLAYGLWVALFFLKTDVLTLDIFAIAILPAAGLVTILLALITRRFLSAILSLPLLIAFQITWVLNNFVLY